MAGLRTGDPGDVLGGDRLLVVGQHVRRCPTEPAQRHIKGGHHRRGGLVPDRQHHPEPRPGQPRHEQRRLHPVDERAVAEVVLQPHPRLGHPRPVHPHPTQAVVTLHRGDRAPGRALRAGVPERDQLVVRDVGAQPTLGALDPLLELGQELIDQLRPRRGPVRQRTGLTGRDVPADGVVRDPGQLTGITQRPGQIERFQHVHDLLGRLHSGPSWGRSAHQHRHRTPGGASTAGRGEADELVSGRSHDRQRATFVTATGQLRGRLRAVSRGRCQIRVRGATRRRSHVLGLEGSTPMTRWPLPRRSPGQEA